MICVAWGGIPSYAACALSRFVKDSSEPVRVIATPSDVPRTCYETIGGEKINWIRDNDRKSFEDIIGEVPRVFVVSGWFIPSFNHLVKQMRDKKRPVVALCDNRLKMGIRLFAWLPYFYTLIRPRFNAFMTPGRSGYRLLRLGGVQPERIGMSLYTADPLVFRGDVPLQRRGKRMVFVGRYDSRKNIIPFTRAFLESKLADNGWKLDCYGQGELEGQLRSLASVSGGAVGVHRFKQPNDLAREYASARVAVLPSLEDHWGVVVHEAALCGCALLLSSEVGAAEDLYSRKNGRVFSPVRNDCMIKALKDLDEWSDEEWAAAFEESQRQASMISPENFSKNLSGLITQLEHDLDAK